MKSRRYLWLIVLLALHGVTATAQVGRTHVIVIGVKRYDESDVRRPWPKYAVQDAELFAAYIKSRPDRQVAAAMLIDNQNGLPATGPNIRNALERMLVRDTGEQDYAYIFISARGHARSGDFEGYLEAVETQTEKGAMSQILVSDLSRYISQTHARHVYIFADVCRESQVNHQDNLINTRLADELRIPGKRVDLILGSEPRKSSFEGDNVSHGFFSYALVNGLKGVTYAGGSVNANSTLLEFFNYMKDRLGSLTKSANPVQQPYPIPRRPDVRLFSQSSGATAVPRMGGLVASAGPPFFVDPELPESPQQSSAAMQQYVDQLLSTEDDQLDSVLGRIAGPLSGAEKFDLAAVLENEGQLVLARYGVGDQFPGDPLQLTESDFRLAHRAFGAAAKLKPSDSTLQSRGLFCFGRLLLFDRRNPAKLDQAERVLRESNRIGEQASKRYRDSLHHEAPEAYNALGIYYLEGGKYDRAVAAFNDAIERAPQWAYPRHNLALAFTEQGRYADAEQAYRAAIEHTPYYPYLHYNLGLLLHRTNRLSASEAEYNRALEWFKQRAETYSEYGRRLRLDQRIQEAEVEEKRAQEALRNRAQAQNALGVLHEAMERPNDAVANYQDAMKSDKMLLAAPHNLALLYRAWRPDQSIRLWEDLVKADPGQLSARIALANLLAERGDRTRARQEFDEILSLTQPQPDRSIAQEQLSIEAHKGSAKLRAAEGAFNAAVQELQTALTQQAESGIAANSSDHELLGDWNAKLDRHAEACRQYELALKTLKPSSEGAKSRRASLKKKALACKSSHSHR